MSDKPKKDDAKKAEGEGHGEAKKKGGIAALMTKLPVMLGGVMVIEAGVLLGAFKMMGGGPAPAEAATELHGHDEHAGASGADAEFFTEEHAAAEGGGGGHGEAAGAPKIFPKAKYTLPIVEFKATNKVSGRMFLFDVQIEAQVTGANLEKAKARLDQRKALISDRVRTIIAQSDPEKLNGQAEPGLETLKRQVKYQIEDVIGLGLIDEILVPRCIPFRADF